MREKQSDKMVTIGMVELKHVAIRLALFFDVLVASGIGGLRYYEYNMEMVVVLRFPRVEANELSQEAIARARQHEC